MVIVHFLLDTKTSIETIEKKYREAIDNPPDITKYELIYTFFREKLGNDWKDGIKEIGEEEGMITFLKEHECKKRNGEKLYNCLIIHYLLNTIAVQLGIQNADILSWQEREASSKPELQHFVENLVAYVDDKEIDSDKTILGGWGGWKYDIKNTQKTLNKSLNSIWFFYEKYHSDINSFNCLPISLWLLIDSSDKLMKKRKKILNKGIKFFGNEMDFKLFIACLNLKNGNQKFANILVKEIESLLSQGLGSEQLRERIMQGLLYLRNGKGTYPEISTFYSERLYKK